MNDRAGVMQRRGWVLSIEGTSVFMVETSTRTPFEVPLSAPGGVLPMAGDQWLLDRSSGQWALMQLVTPRETRYRPHATFRDAFHTMAARGIIDPSFADSNYVPEAPHLAFVGEIRWMVGTPDPYYWLRCDGSTVERVVYRELGQAIDPDGDDTFILPLVDSVGTLGGGRPIALSYICAR